MFAQSCHASMRYAGPVRKEIGIRTVFNIIGPLANPAFANLQLLGVYQKELVAPLARVLANLGVKRGIVVYGNDGLDEVTVSATNTIAEINNGRVAEYVFDPCDLGFKRCRKSDLVGGDARENAQITINILNGTERGAKRDAVVLNSAMSLYIGGRGTLPECVELAKATIDSGSAYKSCSSLLNYPTGENMILDTLAAGSRRRAAELVKNTDWTAYGARRRPCPKLTVALPKHCKKKACPLSAR